MIFGWFKKKKPEQSEVMGDYESNSKPVQEDAPVEPVPTVKSVNMKTHIGDLYEDSDHITGMYDSDSEFEEDITALFSDQSVTVQVNLEQLIKISNQIQQILDDQNYTNALFAIDNLPLEYKKAALYAKVALKLAQVIDEGEYEINESEVLENLLRTCKERCEYL